ncbi:MAG: glycosyltransferase [Phaeodactylibacter xiamenensis]|uniref:Glycosyl transferase family 1 n=1 Tax=Phaeodactylibacter xiamenensis TaxID=1524460 RepID=A0A098S052_9BACT|nr:glycosyltransferase [Phaeodactylibacter xiamenensis]KGE85515.1 glycosyl transferase family 1 [Phaeodactylibacter xiamenensis]MCR9053763.1 glycosyltransferase [bacterium]
MKQVVFLSPAHPLRGGIASSTERLAQELQQHGYGVRILSFSLQYPGFLFPGKTQYTDDPPPARLQIEPLINSINPLNWIKVGRKLKALAPDLIIVRYWLPFMGPALGTILRIGGGAARTKVVAITDNVVPHEHRPGDKAFTRYFLNAVDACVVMSRAVKADIRAFSKEMPVAYIPHPIYDNYGPPMERDAALEQLDLPKDQHYLLFFGFIRGYKGLDLLLQAMALPEVRTLGVKLIVAGEFYDDPEPYQQLIAGQGLEEQIVLRNAYIPNSEVGAYFGAADLVVQPYKTATQSGISQLAFHFGKPMVVTRVGGLPEIVQHGKEGYVVDVSPEAIATAIADFYHNQQQESMENAVRAARSRFSWENMVRGIEALIRQ